MKKAELQEKIDGFKRILSSPNQSELAKKVAKEKLPQLEKELAEMKDEPKKEAKGMDKNKIAIENKASAELEKLGYSLQGRTKDMNNIAVVNPDGKIETFKSYSDALKSVKSKPKTPKEKKEKEGKPNTWSLWVQKEKDGEWAKVNKNPMSESELNVMIREYEKSGVEYYKLDSLINTQEKADYMKTPKSKEKAEKSDDFNCEELIAQAKERNRKRAEREAKNKEKSEHQVITDHTKAILGKLEKIADAIKERGSITKTEKEDLRGIKKVVDKLLEM